MGGCTACSGLVRIEDDGAWSFNLAYYLMTQFSRFMPKGSVVLEAEGSSPSSLRPRVQMVGSVNPGGRRTVVVMNPLGEGVFVRLDTGSGEDWSGNVPGRAVVTWVLPAVG